jgi:hypothetical protein
VFPVDTLVAICVPHFQEQAFAPNEVTFPLDVIPWAFTMLCHKALLVPPNPTSLRDRKGTHDIDGQIARGRYAHPTRWRVDAQVQILDVLPDHVHCDAAQRECLDHQYSR